MIRKIKTDYPTKDVWVYTGYRLRDDFSLENEAGDVFNLPYLNDIDVLVDGKFECATRARDLASHKEVLWRGSSNQRLIDVKQSLDTGKIVERSK